MMSAANKKFSLMPVFLTVLVDLMGFGMILPLLPYTADRFHAPALAIGALYSVYSFSQLVFSPMWGRWSEKVGRRPVMLLSTLGSALSYVVFAFAPNLSVLFFSRVLAGVMGGNISAAQAYVADITTPDNRAKGMGVIGAAFGIGFALGPALSGVLMLPLIQRLVPFAAENPLVLPGLAAAGLSFASFLLVLFRLPESLSVSAKLSEEGRVQKISVFSPSFWSGAFHPAGQGVLGALFLFGLVLAFGHSTLYSAFPLYCSKELALGPDRVAFLFLWMGLTAVVVQGGLLKFLVRRFSETWLFRVGNLLMAGGILLIAFSRTEQMLAASLVLLAVGGSLNGPTLTSLASKASEPHRLGQTLGIFQGMSALGRMIGPAWGGLLFGVTPTTPFIATGLIVLLLFFCAFLVGKPAVS